MAVSRKKGSRRRGGRVLKKGSSSAALSLSIGAVCVALALVLGGLLLHGSSMQKNEVHPPVQLPAEGASDEVASNKGAQGSPEAELNAPATAAPSSVPQASPPRVPREAGKAGAELGGQNLPQLPQITGFRPAKELNATNPSGGQSHSSSIRSSSTQGQSRGSARSGIKRTLIFVVDDAGYSMKQLGAVLALPFPLTVAVLPGLPHSADAARAVRAAGKELILHQPMQAIGGQDPGPGAIRLGMSDEEVEATIEANLSSVPGAVGMNNHMGSAASADLGLMEAAAAVAKRRGIYYLDSRTTSETAIPLAADREGIRYWERDVFLDNTPDRASITRAVEDGKKRSTSDRPAVMIGHVWSAELAQTLTDLYPQLIAEGFSLSTISRFMVQEASEGEE